MGFTGCIQTEGCYVAHGFNWRIYKPPVALAANKTEPRIGFAKSQSASRRVLERRDDDDDDDEPCCSRRVW